MYQTMSYENQLKMKECQVCELLDGALNGTDYQWEGIHGSPIEFRYRNKIEFSFGDAYKDGPLKMCIRDSIKTVSFFVVYVIHHKSDFLVI